MTIPFYTPPELLDAQALSLVQLAQACRTDTAWVVQRVTAGVLESDPVDSDQPPQHWRFSTQTVIRARRIADLERMFDADPELAALTADLMEEVRQLRQRLHGL
ncbi:MAG: MerR family transcriptional regulator [Comamonas sp.]